MPCECRVKKNGGTGGDDKVCDEEGAPGGVIKFRQRSLTAETFV